MADTELHKKVNEGNIDEVLKLVRYILFNILFVFYY
jgi:hypothetical protein